MIIAVVGADGKFCLQLRDLLSSQDHSVILIPEPAETLERLRGTAVSLVVIDGHSSKAALLDLIRSIRGHGPTRHIPVLCVHPSGSIVDVVDILDSGADDLLAKPFNGEVFLARVRCLLRRRLWSGAAPEEPAALLECGELRVHLVERTVRNGKEEPALTRLEFDLLAHLLRHKDRVLPRAEILEAVWNYPDGVETRTLDKHVENLRKKLGRAGSRIVTVHGIGYRLLADKPALKG